MTTAKVIGLDDVKAALLGITPKLRVRALRNALAAGARVVQKAARAATPVLNTMSMAVRNRIRTPGLVRRAISVRTSRVSRSAGNVGVFVNVKPAKGAKYATSTRKTFGGKVKTKHLVKVSRRGAKSPLDPYYWRFINFGTAKGVKAFRFLEAGAAQLPQALQVFTRAIGPVIEKLNKPKAPAP